MDEECQGPGTLVVLATYNERLNIDRLLDPILALPNRCDVLVVDDNSPDGTGAHVQARAAAEPRIKLLSRAGRGGVGSAHREGWRFARRAGYARIVTMDADLSHDPQDIPRFLAALDAGADVALGSRFVAGGRLDYTGWRRFLSRKGNWPRPQGAGIADLRIHDLVPRRAPGPRAGRPRSSRYPMTAIRSS